MLALRLEYIHKNQKVRIEGEKIKAEFGDKRDL